MGWAGLALENVFRGTGCCDSDAISHLVDKPCRIWCSPYKVCHCNTICHFGVAHRAERYTRWVISSLLRQHHNHIFSPQPPPSPQWGSAHAEINVFCWEPTAVKSAPFKTLCGSECSRASRRKFTWNNSQPQTINSTALWVMSRSWPRSKTGRRSKEMWQGSQITSWWAKQDFDYLNTGHRGTQRCDPTDWGHLWIKSLRTNKYPNPNPNLEDWLVFLTEAHQRRDTSVWGHTGVTSAIRIKCVCCDGNWSSVAVVICIRPRGLPFTW